MKSSRTREKSFLVGGGVWERGGAGSVWGFLNPPPPVPDCVMGKNIYVYIFSVVDF